MTSKHKFSILSILIIIAMLCSLFVLPVSAVAEAETLALKKIDTALAKKLETMNDADIVSVSVWFKDINHNELKTNVEKEVKNNTTRSFGVSQKAIDLIFLNEEDTKDTKSLNYLSEVYSDVTTEEVQKAIALKRELASQMHQQNNLRILNEVLPCLSKATPNRIETEFTTEPSIQYVCSYAPNADMYLTKSQIYDIASYDDITEINYRNVNTLDLSSDTNEINNDVSRATSYDMTFLSVTGLSTARDAWGLSGDGMIVGIVEDTNTVSKSLFPEGTIENLDTYSSSGTLHGTLVASVMVGNKTETNANGVTETIYKGAIPEATLYAASAGGTSSGIKTATEKLIAVNGLNVISSSCGYFVSGENGAYYSDMAKWYDYICNFNNVHLSLCAGNYRSHKGPFEVVHSNNAYNAVVVGNCNNNGVLYTGNSELAEASLYSQGNTESYKPDIVAPGVAIPTLIYPDTGTSYSAPLVASAMVQLSQKSSVLFSSPVLMKALLLSGSKITSSMSSESMISSESSTSVALSHPYGAGMLNVGNSYKAFVEAANYKKGTFSQYSSGVTYTKNVTKSVGKTIRVCATWDKVIGFNETSSTNYSFTNKPLDTLKLTVTTPSGKVYRSSYLYDNKQMISFASTENGIYTFELDRVGSGNSATIIDYAIAFSIQ